MISEEDKAVYDTIGQIMKRCAESYGEEEQITFCVTMINVNAAILKDIVGIEDALLVLGRAINDVMREHYEERGPLQ